MMDNVQSHVSATRDDGRARELAGLALVAMIILSVGGAVAASAPADDAREACRADFQSLCAGVQPGAGRVLACLKQNSAELSSGCRQASGRQTQLAFALRFQGCERIRHARGDHGGDRARCVVEHLERAVLEQCFVRMTAASASGWSASSARRAYA